MHKMIVANWKMQLTHNEGLGWLAAHAGIIKQFLRESQNTLVLCPPYTEFHWINSFLSPEFHMGAQDCSAYERGAYTGEISALTLKELGCSYTIIGHSERRAAGDTDQSIAQKAIVLNKIGIIPILCIGESEKERHHGKTFEVLNKHLEYIINAINEGTVTKLLIAYEPLWAVGTQQIPRAADISEVFTWIRRTLQKVHPPLDYALLYGGNVNERTIVDLGLTAADGFLLGRAGVDAEVLKKIILSC